MKKAILIGGGIAAILMLVALAAAVVVGIFILAPSRYETSKRRIGDTEQVVRVERSTGRTEVLVRDAAGQEVWRPVQEESAATRAQADEAARRTAEIQATYARDVAKIYEDQRKDQCERERKMHEEHVQMFGPNVPDPRRHLYTCLK